MSAELCQVCETNEKPFYKNSTIDNKGNSRHRAENEVVLFLRFATTDTFLYSLYSS